jgi:hypothetical protein
MGRRKKNTGLGDVIKTVTDALGVEQCNDCKERQFKLNRLFPFKKVKSEMSDEDKVVFADFMKLKGQRVIDGKTTTLTPNEARYLSDLYLIYFGLDNSNCPECSGIHKTIIKDLFKLAQYD